MNTYTIIANGQELKIYEDIDISINYQIDDILDPGKRKTSFSKTIELPGDPTNNKFFKQIFDVNIDNVNFNPSIKIPAIIRTGDNEILNGSLQLLNVNNEDGEIYYEITIQGMLKDIFSVFDDFTLNELDMTEFNHNRNTSNIMKSWDYNVKSFGHDTIKGGPGYGYVYPYIVNGNSNDIWNRVEIYDLFPAPYVKTVIDKMFEYAGKSYTSNFLDSEYFNKLILPYVGDKLQLPAEELEARSVRAGVNASSEYVDITPEREQGTVWWYNNTNNYNIGLSRESGLVSDNGTDLEFTDDKGQWNQAGIFTCSQMGQYNINFDGKLVLKITHTKGNDIEFKKGNFEYLYRLKVIRAAGGTQILEDTVTDASPNGTILVGMSSGSHSSPWYDIDNPLQFNLGAENVFLNPGDKVVVEIGFRYPSAVKFKGLNSRHRAQLALKNNLDGSFTKLIVEPASNESMGNEDINMNQILPNLKMKDFFLDIIKMFNLIILDNPNKPNDLIIEPRDKFFESKKKHKDWTQKLDRSRNIKITPMSELDANSYLYTYKKDDDYYNKEYSEETSDEIYGQLKIDVDNDFSDKVNKTELSFAPTPIAGQYINDKVAPFFVEKNEVGIKSKKVKPRILFYGGTLYTNSLWVTENGAQTITDGTFTNKYPYCGMWDHPYDPLYDLGFGRTSKIYWNTNKVPVNTLYEQFHKSTLNTITDKNSRMLEGYFYLTPKDIAQFDFRDVIFLDGAYWRVNKIKDYNPVGSENLTKVVLYKIIDYAQQNPFSIELPESNGNCPEDIIAVLNGSSVSSKYSKPYYKSISGKILTPDCCKSIGGNMIDGVCFANFRPGTGVGSGTGIKDKVKDKVNAAVGKLPVSEPSGPISSHDGNNTISKLGNLVLGKNVYISPNKNISNSIVIGDNVTPSKSNELNIQGTEFDKEGITRDDSSIKIDEDGNVAIKAKELNLDDTKEISLGTVKLSGDGSIKYESTYIESGYVEDDYFVKKSGSSGFVYDDYTNELIYKIEADYTEIKHPVIISNVVPTNSLDTSGRIGEFRYDEDYIYIKTISGWKRSVMTTF